MPKISINLTTGKLQENENDHLRTNAAFPLEEAETNEMGQKTSDQPNSIGRLGVNPYSAHISEDPSFTSVIELKAEAEILYNKLKNYVLEHSGIDLPAEIMGIEHANKDFENSRDSNDIALLQLTYNQLQRTWQNCVSKQV